MQSHHSKSTIKSPFPKNEKGPARKVPKKGESNYCFTILKVSTELAPKTFTR
jgi:hypothetical protein